MQPGDLELADTPSNSTAQSGLQLSLEIARRSCDVICACVIDHVSYIAWICCQDRLSLATSCSQASLSDVADPHRSLRMPYKRFLLQIFEKVSPFLSSDRPCDQPYEVYRWFG